MPSLEDQFGYCNAPCFAKLEDNGDCPKCDSPEAKAERKKKREEEEKAKAAAEKEKLEKSVMTAESFSLVVRFDINKQTLEEAFEELFRKMEVISTKDFQWESSDEAYTNPEGKKIDHWSLMRARVEAYKKMGISITQRKK